MKTIRGALAPEAKRARIEQLRELLDQRKDQRGNRPRKYVSTGFEQLDRHLPHRGLPCGAITELIAPSEGCGAATLAFNTAREASHRQGFVVVVDMHASWYMPALWTLGFSSDQLLLIYPRTISDALLAMEQSLACSAVSAVVTSVRQLRSQHSRRLQLAAERGNTLGLVVRSRDDGSNRSFASVRMLIEPEPGQAPLSEFDRVVRRFCRVTLCKVWEWRPTETLVIGLDHETNTCDSLSILSRRVRMHVAEQSVAKRSSA